MERGCGLLKLIVAIPAFNEEDVLSSVLKNLRRNLSKERDCQILVVNDGSTDNTKNVAIASGADIVVSHKKNRGVAQAYRTAIRAALEFGADIICTIDGDGQFDCREIPSLIEPIKAGKADLVIGSRFIDSKLSMNIPTMNRVFNKLMAMLVSLIIRKQIHDTESGFRAISKTAAADLNLLGLVSFSNDMILDVSAKKHKIMEVPVTVKYYDERVSRVIKGFVKYGFKSLCLIVLKCLSLKFSVNPFSSNYPSIEVVKISNDNVTTITSEGNKFDSPLLIKSQQRESVEALD